MNFMSKSLKPSEIPTSEPFDWQYKVEGNPKGIPILWFHGFMGNSHDWLDLTRHHFSDFCNVMVDLPGHGLTHLPSQMNFSEALKTLVNQLGNAGIEFCISVGYSMGGRVLFHLHENHPAFIKAQVFLSSAPGLKSQTERDARAQADKQLMNRLDSEGFTPFLEDWYAAELFGNIRDNPRLYMDLISSRCHNEINQLRRSLILMGNGALPSLWGSLKNISVPTLLLTGELDSKYYQLNQEMHDRIPGSAHYQIEEAGHAFHLEKPVETALRLRQFLGEII